MPVSVTVPVLWSVKIVDGSNVHWAIPTTPTPGQLLTWDTVHDGGVRLALITEAVPVPLRDTGEPATTKLPAMLAVPVTGVELTTVGVNTTLMEQFAPAASVVPQVPPAVARENGPVKATAIPVRGWLPVLLSVRVNAALVAPTPTLPKLCEVGDTLAPGAGQVPVPAFSSSIAPMSALHPLPSGLGWPKKSVLGSVTPPGRPVVGT